VSQKIIKKKSQISFIDCSGCGAKCCQSNIIFTSLYDIEKVTKFFPIFFLIQNGKISLVYFFYYGEKENEHCPYLQNDLCSIYEERPYACKSYPFSNQKNDIYYSTTCPHLIEKSTIGMQLIKNKKINKQIFTNFLTTDFINKQKNIMQISEEFVHFCDKNNLLIPYEKHYANKEIYINFKPSIQKNLYLIHPFKIAALRLNGQKLFEGKEIFLTIIQRLIQTQSNVEKLFKMKR